MLATRFRAVALVAALAVALSVVGGGAADAQRTRARAAAKPDPKAILKYGDDLSTFGGPALDPITSVNGGAIDFDFDYLIYDTLVHIAPDGSYQPGLAASWKVVDPQTLDLTLRSGVKFQDGSAFDADAVKKAIDRSLASKNGSFNPAFYKIDQVTASAPLTVRIHLSEPAMDAFFPMLHSLATMVPSPKAIDSGNLAKSPVGAGPFKFTEFVPDDHLSVRKYAGYWDAKSYLLAGVDFIHQASGGPSGITTLLANEIDLGNLSTEPEAQTLTDHPGYKLFKQASDNNLYLMTMCLTSPPFDKLAVRQAVAMSINRKEINAGALDGLGSETALPVASSSQFSFKDLANKYPYNPKKAKQMLKKAGVKPGTELDFLEPPVPSFLGVASVVEGDLNKVGFDAKSVQSTNVVQDLFVDNKAPTAVLFTTDPGIGGLLPYLSPNGTANLCGYKNPKLDAAFAAINTSFGDPTKAKQAYRDLETVLVDDLPLIFLIYPARVVGFNAKVHGISQIFEQGTVNLRKVYISK